MDEPQILIIDDSPSARWLAVKSLDRAGYKCHEAVDGEAGVVSATQLKPDLILLDCVMPRMDGIEVLRRLREYFGTCHIPVVMLTSMDEMDQRVELLNAGADDYVIKPFDERDLVARVMANLRRNQQSLSADPSTKLPGNLVIRRHLQEKLRQGAGCSLVYIDLDNFKSYVDFYGFERAGDVIHAVAHILNMVVVEHGSHTDFIGHIGGDDFLMVVEPSNAESISRGIVNSFACQVPKFYSPEHHARGYIEGKDRYGTHRRFPLLSISVAVIDIPAGISPAPADVATFAGRCKQEIKNDRGAGWRRYEFSADRKSE